MISPQTIIDVLQQFQLPAMFVGVFFLSEAVIIPSSVLAKQGVFNWYTVFVVALVSTTLSDLMWFKFGTIFLRHTHRLGKYQKNVHKLMHAVERMTGKRTYLFLIIYKFFYGFRSLTIIALSMRKYSILRFGVFTALGSVVWLAVLMGVGWLIGLGFDVLHTVHTVEYIIGGAVAVFVAYKILTLWLGRELEEEEEKIEQEEHQD